jgi:glycosyltransferase involved in cell wall biosynthesis
MKRKILFFVEFNAPIRISWGDLEIGNPGVGGTQYTTLCLAKELSKLDQYEVAIACESDLTLGADVDVFRLTIDEAVEFAENYSYCLVYRPTITFQPTLLQKLSQTRASVIAWAHVGPSQQTLRILASLNSIKRVVALGERELISWYDNPVIQKSVLIRNGHHIPDHPKNVETDFNAITYIGSIVPQKGFHLLAEVWPKVVEQHPNLYLNVVGSGNLYSSTTGLGPLGIATPSYETLIEKNLGTSIESVRFLGKLGGKSKNTVVASSYIGIINPSGNTENCPLSALDFQSLSVPVFSAKRYGVIDTVLDGSTGKLFKNYTDLPDLIDQVIRNPEERRSLSANCIPFIQERFNFTDVVKQWDELFSNLDNPISASKVKIREAVNFVELLTILNGGLLRSLNLTLQWPTVTEVNLGLRKLLKKIISVMKLQVLK